MTDEWKTVPAYPTEQMYNVFIDEINKHGNFQTAYYEMLQVASEFKKEILQ